MKSDSLKRLKNSLLDLDMEGAVAHVHSIINGEGVSSAREAVDAVSDALQVVGRRFQDGEWFLAELVYAGEIAKEVMALLSPLLPVGASQQSGTVIVGTVAGDFHDLGKNIFVNYARSTGFEVIDLGVDVSKEKFASAVSEHDPLVLGMSCLLTITSGEIENVIEELKSRGSRDKIKVIVGGAALTAQFARDVGADAFAADAVTGTDIIKEWVAA